MFNDRIGNPAPIVRESIRHTSNWRIVQYAARRNQASQDRVASMWGDQSQRGRSMTSYVIGIAVAALVVAIIIPVAFSQFFATVTTSWDAQTILIWGIIPVIVILAIVLYFLNKADDQS